MLISILLALLLTTNPLMIFRLALFETHVRAVLTRVDGLKLLLFALTRLHDGLVGEGHSYR